MTELVIFESVFPDGVDYTNVKFRAVVWILSELVLLLAILSNFMPRTPLFSFAKGSVLITAFSIARMFTWIFRASLLIIVIDYLLLMIWLPVGVSKTYGFQTAKWVFTEQFNGTGAVGFKVTSAKLSVLITIIILSLTDGTGLWPSYLPHTYLPDSMRVDISLRRPRTLPSTLPGESSGLAS